MPMSAPHDRKEYIDSNVHARPKLTGWSAVEHYMRGHDESMVKDYADDVDTLLVFAGLFSAVLTAFLVLSYALLQIDNSQTTVDLLTRISGQLENLRTSTSPGSANSTNASSLLSSQAFLPSAAVIWINCLWFLSLVVSLASAFFGILVKQWLREYMKWNASLGDPKENVLVRQIRYEDWNDWHVDTIIGAIPGFLELAVILFVVGLVILLWTVDFAVALTVTIAVAIFLLLASFLLTAPVFFKRCPYKSPTARAFVILFSYEKRPYEPSEFKNRAVQNFSLRRIWSKIMSPRLANWGVFRFGKESGVPSWKDREIQNSPLRYLRDCNGSLSNASAVYSHELQTHVRSDSASGRVLSELGKATILLRALVWVAKASQDERVVANVASSAESLHSADLSYDIRYLSDIHILSSSIGSPTTTPETTRSLGDVSNWLPLVSEYTLPKLDGTMTTLLQVLRLCYYMPETNRARRVGGHLAVTPDQGFGFADKTWYSKGNWFCSRLHFDIFLRLLVGDIKSTVLELVRLAKSRPPFTEPVTIGCRAMGLLCALHRLIRASRFKWPDLQFYRYDTALESLIDAYNFLSTDPQADCIDEDWCPGLRTSIIATICTFIDVQFNTGGKLELAGDSPPEVSPSSSMALANLAITYDNSMQGRSYRREDCSCLVAITNIFLRGMVWQNIMPERHWQTFSSETVAAVVEKMIFVAQTSLDRSYGNCGSYKKLPWLSTFTLRNFWLITPDQLGRLLDILQESDEKGLLTDEVKIQLARARSVVAYFKETPDGQINSIDHEVTWFDTFDDVAS